MYILQNWDSIVAIVAIVILVALTIAKVVISLVTRIKAAKEAGEKANQIEILQQIIFGLVTDAERDLGAGTGKLKFSKVAGWVYEKIPDELKLLFTAGDIEDMIESVLEEAQEYWDKNTSAREYIDGGAANLLTAEIEAATPPAGMGVDELVKAVSNRIEEVVAKTTETSQNVPEALDDKIHTDADNVATAAQDSPAEGKAEPPTE